MVINVLVPMVVSARGLSVTNLPEERSPLRTAYALSPHLQEHSLTRQQHSVPTLCRAMTARENCVPTQLALYCVL